MSLPRSAVLVLWLNACLRGSVGVDDFSEAVRDDDPQHLVIGWPGTPGAFALDALPAAVQALGTPSARLALPSPGDPLGLAGPADFNADAVEAEEAVVLVGRTGSVGLVPALDARTVLWHGTRAEVPTILDPREESRRLRQTLLAVTAELARLDVASWSPEIPDLLMNLHHREDLLLPRGTSPEDVEALERAALCAEIVSLARTDDGGSVTAHEAAERKRCLTELDVAARRTIVAVCSASLQTS